MTLLPGPAASGTPDPPVLRWGNFSMYHDSKRDCIILEFVHEVSTSSQTIWACQVGQREKVAIRALELSLSNGVVRERTGSSWGHTRLQLTVARHQTCT
jgi:hypothetical protein